MNNLNQLVDHDIAEGILAQLNHEPFRRLTNKAETSIDPSKLCQALHINKMAGDAKLILGDAEDGYYMHSIESVKPVIEDMLSKGIKRTYLGTDAVIQEESGYLEKLDNFSNILRSLRKLVGNNVEIIVDPAGLCLRKDLRWGISDSEGHVDAEGTLALLAQASVAFADSGADALLTIGRTNCEVQTVNAAVAKAGKHLKVQSFSTNSETTSAYFETTKDNILRSRTGQKILVGNLLEMLIRAISDFGEGSDTIVQKPVESFQINAILNALSQKSMPAQSIVNNEKVQKLLADNPLVKPAFDKGVELIETGSKPLKTGTYEVSGTFSNLRLLKQSYSEQLAWSALDEILLNAASAAGDSLEIMISRSASWYLEKRKIYGNRED